MNPIKFKHWIPAIAMLSLFFAAILFLFYDPYSSVRIDDIRKQQDFILKATPGSKFVTSSRVCVEGSLDGQARFEIEGHEAIIVTGKFSVALGSDWYDNEKIVLYRPINVSSGKCVIHWKIE